MGNRIERPVWQAARMRQKSYQKRFNRDPKPQGRTVDGATLLADSSCKTCRHILCTCLELSFHKKIAKVERMVEKGQIGSQDVKDVLDGVPPAPWKPSASGMWMHPDGAVVWFIGHEDWRWAPQHPGDCEYPDRKSTAAEACAAALGKESAPEELAGADRPGWQPMGYGDLVYKPGNGKMFAGEAAAGDGTFYAGTSYDAANTYHPTLLEAQKAVERACEPPKNRGSGETFDRLVACLPEGYWLEELSHNAGLKISTEHEGQSISADIPYQRYAKCSNGGVGPQEVIDYATQGMAEALQTRDSHGVYHRPGGLISYDGINWCKEES